jgi:hypothetical protein
MRVRLLAWAGVVLLLGSTATPAAEMWVDVTSLTHEHVQGALQKWDEQQLVVAGDTNVTIPTSDLITVRFPRHVRRQPPTKFVVLVNGDRVAADAVRVHDEQLTATWVQAPLRKELQVPLEQVAATIFAAPPGRREALSLLAEVGRVREGHDTVRLMSGDQLTGEFTGLAGGLVEFAAAVGPLKLDRSRVRWLALDPDLAAAVSLPDQYWTVFLTDGSRLTVRSCVPQADFTVLLTPLVGGPVTVPWYEIQRLQHRTQQWESLADREPLEERYQPYLEGQSLRQQNRSAAGSPMQLRGEEFATGLGVRSQTTVTYAIDSKDQWFQTTVGLDDAAGDHGSVRFRIALDGREVWTSDLVTSRRERLETPRIEVRGSRRLSLIVDYGERGDIGDLADWCDPFVVRTP